MTILRVAWCLGLLACGGDDGGPRPTVFGGDRPVELDVPPSFDEGRAYPLVLGLHGYGSSGFVHAAYFGLPRLVSDGEALVLAPDGTIDASNKPFWNADPACCDFGGANPDDVGYLGGLIDDVMAAYPVDPDQVYVIGHSNGSFMAYRLACERADVITAIAGLAGVASSDPASCVPERPVSVLHIHGTADDIVPFDGGALGGQGAVGSVEQWARHDACDLARTAGTPLDLEAGLAGAETTVEVSACPPTVAVDLWRVEGASHVPVWGPSFTPALWQWLSEHRRR